MFDTLYILALRSINTKIEKLKNNIPTEITEKMRISFYNYHHVHFTSNANMFIAKINHLS